MAPEQFAQLLEALHKISNQIAVFHTCLLIPVWMIYFRMKGKSE